MPNSGRSGSSQWIPYVVPFGLYMAFLVLQAQMPDALVWVYPVKTLVVAAALFFFRRAYEELKPGFSWLAVAVGVIVIVIWIGIDPYYPKLSALMGGFDSEGSAPPAAPFDPTTISPDALRVLFLVFRVAGAALVVPLMEELFWRGFLIRWIENPNFKSVPVGKYGTASFLFTVVLFGLEHEQWLAGVICGALYNGLLYRTKSLFACVLAHAVSNATLAAWVIARHDWKFW